MYLTHAGMSAKFILATLYDTMYVFHLYKFMVRAVLCDGASSNLSALKLLTGFGSGAFGSCSPEKGENVHYVKTFFLNPYDNMKTFTLICPSHQVWLYKINFQCNALVCDVCKTPCS